MLLAQLLIGDIAMATVTHLHNNKPKTVTEWRNYISEPWQKAVESIVETGQRLIEARGTDEIQGLVAHGDWEKIFEKNKPFSVRTARCLIAIAEHPVLSNRQYPAVLPPHWYTLYLLSTIPEHLLLQMIKDGKVHSELTQREAEELQNWEEQIKQLQALLLRNSHNARELSLADCGGGHYDCSILRGAISQELIDMTQEVIDVWTKLRNHLISLREVKEDVRQLP
jgi:hypothetical protein